MKRIFFTSMTLIIASMLMVSCDPAANTGNKPANAPANNAAAKPAADKAAVEADIKKAVGDMAASLTKGDAAAFEKLYSENYMFVGPDGSVSTGAQRIASMKSGDTKYESVTYDEITVRSNAEGTGAVSISRATVKGKNMGKTVDGQFRVTHIWTKTKDGWHLASGQTTPITAVEPAKAGDKSKDEAPKAPAANAPANK